MLKKDNAMKANLDWSQCPAVESIPGKVAGMGVSQHARSGVSDF